MASKKANLIDIIEDTAEENFEENNAIYDTFDQSDSKNAYISLNLIDFNTSMFDEKLPINPV